MRIGGNQSHATSVGWLNWTGSKTATTTIPPWQNKKKTSNQIALPKRPTRSGNEMEITLHPFIAFTSLSLRTRVQLTAMCVLVQENESLLAPELLFCSWSLTSEDRDKQNADFPFSHQLSITSQHIFNAHCPTWWLVPRNHWKVKLSVSLYCTVTLCYAQDLFWQPAQPTTATLWLTLFVMPHQYVTNYLKWPMLGDCGGLTSGCLLCWHFI